MRREGRAEESRDSVNAHRVAQVTDRQPADRDRAVEQLVDDLLLGDPLGQVLRLELDLGGIVKEYAADCAARVLSDAGIEHALVNLGGDVRAVGPRADGAPWRIGVRHPRRPDGLVATVSISEGALATSGDYERCIEVEGVRYGHVLDPRTGWPVRHLASVTVLPALLALRRGARLNIAPTSRDSAGVGEDVGSDA